MARTINTETSIRPRDQGGPIVRPQASEPTAFCRNPIHGMRRRNLGAARDEGGSASSAHFVPSQELTGRWPQGCPARAPRPRVPQVFPRFETAALSSTPRRQRTAATMHRARREHGFSCGVLRPWNLMKIAVHASGDAHAPPDGMASDSEMRDMSRSPSRYVIAVWQLNVIAAWEEYSKNYKYILAAKRRRIVAWFFQSSLLCRTDISSCRHPIGKSNPKNSLSFAPQRYAQDETKPCYYPGPRPWALQCRSRVRRGPDGEFRIWPTLHGAKTTDSAPFLCHIPRPATRRRNCATSAIQSSRSRVVPAG